MADEPENKFLQILPCEAKDYNKARCRMDIKTMEYLGLIVGSPVRIKVGNRYVFCNVWPLKDVEELNIIQFDDLVTLVSTQNVHHCCTQYLSIHQDISKLQPKECQSISVNVSLRNIENTRNRISKTLYETQLARRLRFLMKQVAITKGSIVRPRQSKNTNNLYCGISSIVVNDIQSNIADCAYHEITDTTNIKIESVKIAHCNDDDITQFSMAGLDDAAQMLREMLCYPFDFPESFVHMGLECPKGILIQGVPGVGKSLLVKKVTADCNAQLISINGTDIFGPHSGESEENLRKTFEQASFASRSSPCVLFIDELDALCPKRGTSGNEEENRIVAQLLTLMDGIKCRGRLVIIGATNRPNAIDSALRRPGRFDREVVIGVPGPVKRLAILQAHAANLNIAIDVDLSHIAEITIGYVGADLASLCREAAFTAMKRTLQVEKESASSYEVDRSVKMCDFQLAMCHITPSTHRGMEGLLDVQPISWSNIGGLHEVKKALKQAIEWPLKYPEAFSRLGLGRPRAVLLYGPPGCCKTTLVQALASSCYCTFLSLSCAQLYSPYVGDAERMIREVFLKARATAPSILFLDELDSIAGKRSDSNVNDVATRLLSSLLNEIDGVGVSANIYDSTTGSLTASKCDGTSTLQQGKADINSDEIEKSLSNKHRLAKLQNVKDLILVAATNRPWAIDEALLRPGRIDRMVYVPPPDRDARLEILKVHTSTSPISCDVNLELLADKTDMFSGADLENFCREAALFALEENLSASKINSEHFDKALLTVKPSLNEHILSSYKQLL